ncbi:MAG: hypothetical protein ACRDPS_01155 [Nocardioides sp.]|uniref:hypothetical protein n=1 Tax=Nocardioides sp. TaxID=35761 RepID=UPI003D6A81E6
MTDPFFAVLRERRPDIDIVILPPDRAAPVDPATPADLARSAEVVDATVAAITARLPDPQVDGPTWEAFGPGLVRRRAALSTRTAEGGTILRTLERAFAEARWSSRLQIKAFHRWTAGRGDVDVVATWSERHDGLTVTVTGHELRTDGPEES